MQIQLVIFFILFPPWFRKDLMILPVIFELRQNDGPGFVFPPLADRQLTIT
ncbi:hypothetical protein GPEL0_01r0675 [Geoanaerobacter pelophilus]|uniref:Uncharacterized protein n=1 Tax=Geoanaerobacter pelophilus TaxID=60036 RepID=A0ABQ0MEZ5_9BACT|nr:hypothetical protein GPEL0_01r0675 [Geoanaerobacter pelophilus]